jgi:hypothetical protein
MIIGMLAACLLNRSGSQRQHLVGVGVVGGMLVRHCGAAYCGTGAVHRVPDNRRTSDAEEGYRTVMMLKRSSFIDYFIS